MFVINYHPRAPKQLLAVRKRSPTRCPRRSSISKSAAYSCSRREMIRKARMKMPAVNSRRAVVEKDMSVAAVATFNRVDGCVNLPSRANLQHDSKSNAADMKQISTEHRVGGVVRSYSGCCVQTSPNRVARLRPSYRYQRPACCSTCCGATALPCPGGCLGTGCRMPGGDGRPLGGIPLGVIPFGA